MPNNDCAHFRFILQKLYEYATIQNNILYTIYRLDGWIMGQLKFYHIVLWISNFMGFEFQMNS
jgi:hypothetical protein